MTSTPYENWADHDDRDDPFIGYIGIDRGEFHGLPETEVGPLPPTRAEAEWDMEHFDD